MDRPSPFALLTRVALVALIALVAGYLAGAHRNVAQPVRSVHVRGILGRDLGEPMTIEGILLDGEQFGDKGELGKTLVAVSAVDGAPRVTERPIEICFAIGEKPDIPPHGTRVSCYGFESGAFIGIPAKALATMPDVQVPHFHLQTHFVVLQLAAAKVPAI